MPATTTPAPSAFSANSPGTEEAANSLLSMAGAEEGENGQEEDEEEGWEGEKEEGGWEGEEGGEGGGGPGKKLKRKSGPPYSNDHMLKLLLKACKYILYVVPYFFLCSSSSSPPTNVPLNSA